MSSMDYLCCKKCDGKIFYDAHDDLLDRLDDYFDGQGLLCPDCVEKVETELAEARAEIEALKNKNAASISAHMWLIMRQAFMSGAYKGYAHGTEKKLLEQMFAEFCNKDYPEVVEKEAKRWDEIERKDKLIEQMREALEAVAPLLHWLDQEQNVSIAGDMLHGKILAAIRAAKGAELL